jgi:hypothetical protein
MRRSLALVEITAMNLRPGRPGAGPPSRRSVAALLATVQVALAGACQAQEVPAPAREVAGVTVIDVTPLPGTGIDIDKTPANTQTLGAADLRREGSPDVIGALGDQLGSININDDLDDAFQPDILLRGFEASPVLGTPQGVAVYQNGVRINEAFGDTVNWDLFPSIAINRVDLVSSSPVYGLNALGGGISISMKDGFSYHGSDVELSASMSPATRCRTPAGDRTRMIRCASCTRWSALAASAARSISATPAAITRWTGRGPRRYRKWRSTGHWSSPDRRLTSTGSIS